MINLGKVTLNKWITCNNDLKGGDSCNNSQYSIVNDNSG